MSKWMQKKRGSVKDRFKPLLLSKIRDRTSDEVRNRVRQQVELRVESQVVEFQVFNHVWRRIAGYE